ncbi:hypothetical protein [Saprospira grandis]|uniref:Lipoprotein n=1 Tax=Saprospira grandis (strain Lewin) TaxID=984262 RepID=H6L4H4_SAPGL|nr:hypothetical protein [Saprospira grandis]AFC22853.1 hypothetical protein SGRA_0108 [Saprospira grandis str. Lewin]
MMKFCIGLPLLMLIFACSSTKELTVVNQDKLSKNLADSCIFKVDFQTGFLNETVALSFLDTLGEEVKIFDLDSVKTWNSELTSLQLSCFCRDGEKYFYITGKESPTIISAEKFKWSQFFFHINDKPFRLSIEGENKYYGINYYKDKESVYVISHDSPFTYW